uniref:Uncharacterized protein n=1 Tax=Acrobeloides nanus TaxID=290746 RepID=A0A914CUP0_9BILA
MFLFEAHFDNQVPVLLATIFNLGFQLIFIGMSLGFILLLKGMREQLLILIFGKPQQPERRNAPKIAPKEEQQLYFTQLMKQWDSVAY